MPTIKWTESRFLRVPLTPDEQRERGQQLARAFAELADAQARHKTARDHQKDEENQIEGRIAKLASIVREGFEERAVPVEMRIDVGLGMVEEVRTDTGEIVKTREATRDDKVKAQALSQSEIPGTETRKDEA